MSQELVHTLELAVGSIMFGLLVIKFSRSRKISFRYTTGWLVLCGLGIFASILLPMVAPVADFMQLSPTALLIVIAAIGSALLFLQLTVSISGNQRSIENLVRENALLKEKLNITLREHKSESTD